MMRKPGTLPAGCLCVALLLGSCGEIGTDERGPYKAYLVLQDEKGAERDFYLGGYNKLEDCFDILQYEAGDASERGYETWTNPEFTYGGRKQDGWIRHKIVGGFCAFVGK